MGTIINLLTLSDVIRRDLKPSNILYRKGQLASADWGSATHEGEASIVPTLSYRSPELLIWKQESDPARWTCGIDVWSWGYVT